MSEINSENIADTTAENTAAENTTETKITDEEIAQNMTEVGFMANVLKDSKLGGATIKNAPLLGASNDTVEESDEETDVITMAELEKGGKHNTVRLGRQGESNTQTVEFDLGDWMSEVPNGVATIVARRAGESETYLAIGVAYNVETHIATWPITSIDTAYPGYGEAEIRISNSDQTIVKKSARFRTYVEKSVEDYTGEAVTPPYWAVDIISQAQSASESASAAARDSGIASSMATSAESAASDSEGSARRAEAAATSAVADAANAKATMDLYAYNVKMNGLMSGRGLYSIVSRPMEVGSINASGEDQDGDTSRRSADYIPVTAGATLLYRRAETNTSVYQYDANKGYLRKTQITASGKLEQAVTLGDDTEFIRILVASVGTGDVYDMDWGIFGGNVVIPLTNNTSLTSLKPGRYSATAAVAATLTNCPVTTAFTLDVAERSYEARGGGALANLFKATFILYSGDNIYLYNDTAYRWIEFTGTAVN